MSPHHIKLCAYPIPRMRRIEYGDCGRRLSAGTKLNANGLPPRVFVRGVADNAHRGGQDESGWIPRAAAILLAFFLALGSAEVARAQEMSSQQRDFAALYTQCAERIRKIDAEAPRQSARDACQAQLQQLIGSKLDDWVGRVTRVRVERDTVELELAPFDGEKVAVLTSILNMRIYTSDRGEMSSQPYYQQLASQLEQLNVRRGESVRVTSTMLTGELPPGMLPHVVRYATDRLEISVSTMTVTRP